MPATHHRDFIHQLRALLVFIEFNFFICILIGMTEKDTFELSPITCPTYTTWSCSGFFKDMKRDATANSWLTSYTDIPGCQNFVRMPLVFFDLIRECIHHHIKKSASNFIKSLEVGLNLAIMLRHMATGETYTSFQYHWLVGKSTICKFLPQVC